MLPIAYCVSHRSHCLACRTKLGQHQDHKSVLEPPDDDSFGARTGSLSFDFLCDNNSSFHSVWLDSKFNVSPLKHLTL